MTFLQEITNRYPIRKREEQKEAFLKYAAAAARKMGYEARVEEDGRHKNLVVGSPENANVLITAHYDTPANMLLPNLIIPRNIPLFLLYQLAYAEMIFPSVLWPDFTVEEYDRCLRAFATRDRRYGGRRS